MLDVMKRSEKRVEAKGRIRFKNLNNVEKLFDVGSFVCGKILEGKKHFRFSWKK